MQLRTRALRWLLVVVSPALLAPKGCHFGSDDVSLGTNVAAGDAGEGGEAGTGPAGGEGSVSVAGSAPSTGGNISAGGSGAPSTSGRGGATGGIVGSGGVFGSGGTAIAAGRTGAGSDGVGGGGGYYAGSGGIGAGGSYYAGSGGSLSAGQGGYGGMGGGYAGGLSVPYWVCGLPTDQSVCESPLPRDVFAFSTESMACEIVTADCEPTTPLENQFGSRTACETTCTTYALDIPLGPAPTTSGGEPAACMVPPSPPNCDDRSVEHYYFDPRTGECFRQPCLSGTKNHFPSLSECLDACLPNPLDEAVGAAAVVEGSSCAGFGEQLDITLDDFSVEASSLALDTYYGCGCPSRAQYVLTYEFTSPLRLRLCRDSFASACQEACSGTLVFDVAAAMMRAGASEFVFVSPPAGE